VRGSKYECAVTGGGDLVCEDHGGGVGLAVVGDGAVGG
jgi:hypothetical protein